MRKVWFDEAWDDYVSWQREDKKTLKRINALVKDIERGNGFDGIGKPEPLRGNLSGLGCYGTTHRITAGEHRKRRVFTLL